MSKCFFIGLCWISALVADAGSVSSTHAAYDGQALVLTGLVELDHTLGQMRAEKALLSEQAPAGEAFPFTHIALHKDVLLSLADRGSFRCAHATLDFTTLKGALHAEEGEKVSYTDLSGIPLRLDSRQIDLQFEKKLSNYTVDTLLAQGTVVIHYNNEWVLHTDQALYSHGRHQITAARPSHIVHPSGKMDAEEISWDLENQVIDLKKPQGTLSTHNPDEPVSFLADSLQWNAQSQRMTLNEHVHIEQRTTQAVIDADTAYIDFVTTTPTHLTLKGNIRLKTPPSAPVQRRAVSDHLHYSFATHTLILSADPRKKVLFVDDDQQTKISADEVHIVFDPETKEQTIRGIGNVRVTLSAEENALLQQLFPDKGL